MGNIKKSYVVVAAIGNSVLVTVDNFLFDIDCYTPVDLSIQFSIRTLNTCKELQDSLKQGFLIYYKDGDPLPVDPNKKRLDALKVQQDILATTKSQEITPEFKANLEIAKQKSKEARKEKDIKVLDNTQVNNNGADLKRVLRATEMKAKDLVKPVTMDVSLDKFQESKDDALKTRVINPAQQVVVDSDAGKNV